MRMGIIGFGRAGAVHSEALKLVPELEAVAVCDPSRGARERAQAEGMEAYADVATMLQRARLDAVTVCTPPAHHAETAIRCLESGLHVLCEKPLALSTRDVIRMLQTANRERRHVLVASKFRHVPELALARAMIHSGELGDPVSFEVSFCSPVDMSERWNATRAEGGGGVIIDNGCHAFDIVSYLFGSIVRIHATSLKPLQRLAVEDSATVQIWAGDGVIGRVDLSWSLLPTRDNYLVVTGSRGALEIGWRAARVKSNGHEWRQIGGAYDKVNAHRRMHASFVDAVSNRAEPWITTVECLQAVAAVDAAYRSLQSGFAEWVAIQGVEELSLVSLSTTNRMEVRPSAL